jgi:hypothetical protein
MTKPLIVFCCEGKAALALVNKICNEARGAGLSAEAEIDFQRLGGGSPSVSISQAPQPKNIDPRQYAQRLQQLQQQQSAEQALVDAWQIMVAGSVPIAAFAVFAKNCLDIFAKTKEVLKPLRSIEVMLDGRKIEIRSGDEIQDFQGSGPTSAK